MLVQTAHIIGTTPEQYDALLALGWFRGTGVIYRSELVCMDEEVYAVSNIRLPLTDFEYRKKHRRLLRKNDEKFTVTCRRPSVDEARERLYRLQSRRFKAFVHQSLDEIISPDMGEGGFFTGELGVYDGEKLVAVSYFDIGGDSMASIMCLYDPAYAKDSLGIYTMLKEVEIAKARGLSYYYPGYVLDRPSSFDYKLSLGQCEWMTSSLDWVLQDHLTHRSSRADILRDKMAEIQLSLGLAGFQSSLRLYPYFTVGYVMKDRPSLLRYPCYYEFRDGEMILGASYDLESGQFVIFEPDVAEEYEFSQHLDLSDDYKNSEAYELRIMKSSFYLQMNNLDAIRQGAFAVSA